MKKHFALRVDKEIFDAVEKWAAEEFRSANGQIEWILHAALKKAGRLPKKKSETNHSQNEIVHLENPNVEPVDTT